MNERITRMYLAEAGKHGRTDWERLRGITDEELEAAIASDPDASIAADGEIDPLATLVFKDPRGKWRWRLLGPDGKAIADSPRGYADRSDVDEALRKLRETMQAAEAKAA
ncbi:MAG TPA: YegP family protein [Sphingomicrobium sp.]|nr:YegP family protein [Sphingomicrobium sp.]